MLLATCYSPFTPGVQLSTAYCLLPTAYYSLPTTYHLLLTTYHHLLLTIYHLLPTTYYLLPTTYYLLPTTYYLLPLFSITPGEQFRKMTSAQFVSSPLSDVRIRRSIKATASSELVFLPAQCLLS